MYNAKVRIYDPYDLDLIALCEAKNFSIQYAIKTALKYYAQGKRITIEIPDLPDSREKTSYARAIAIPLDESEDADAINLIESVQEGLRNSFIKNIFRASLEVSPVSLYFQDMGNRYVQSLVRSNVHGTLPAQRPIIVTTEDNFSNAADAETPFIDLVSTNRNNSRKKKKSDKPKIAKPAQDTSTSKLPVEKPGKDVEEKKEDLPLNQKKDTESLKINTKMQIRPVTDNTGDDSDEDLDDLMNSLM